MSNKKGGRRRSAIDPAVADLLATDRRATKSQDAAPAAESIRPASIPPPLHTNKKVKAKPKKTVTSVRVLFSTLAKIQQLKIRALEEGKQQTIGAILDEAVSDLFRKKGLS